MVWRVFEVIYKHLFPNNNALFYGIEERVVFIPNWADESLWTGLFKRGLA